jgi:hypothetical protein
MKPIVANVRNALAGPEMGWLGVSGPMVDGVEDCLSGYGNNPLTFRTRSVTFSRTVAENCAVFSSAKIARVLVCLSLASCAPQLWAKPGGSPAEFEGAKEGCNTQSYSMFPPMMQQIMVTSGYMTPMQTNCTNVGYSVSCYTTGGNYVPPVYMPVDQNQGARNSAFRSCLMTAGWQPVKDKEEAALVTNSAAHAPLQSVPASSDRETSIAECRVKASATSDFPNAFDGCMKAHGF